jgi:hypothetical protein
VYNSLITLVALIDLKTVGFLTSSAAFCAVAAGMSMGLRPGFVTA